MCESRAQFRSTRLWTLNDWVDTAAGHNGGDAITICHKAAFERSLSPECIKLHSAKKNCYQSKIHSNLWSMSCQSNHSQDIPPNVLHWLSRMPRTWSERLLGNYYPASVDCIPSKQRQRTRKTGDHFAGWDFSVDTRVQRSIYCGFRPKEVDHAWFPMNSVEFIQA